MRFRKHIGLLTTMTVFAAILAMAGPAHAQTQVTADEAAVIDDLLEQEATYRHRCAVIHRLRELATESGDHEQLGMLDELEIEIETLHRERIESAREHLRRAIFANLARELREGRTRTTDLMDTLRRQQAIEQRETAPPLQFTFEEETAPLADPFDGDAPSGDDVPEFAPRREAPPTRAAPGRDSDEPTRPGSAPRRAVPETPIAPPGEFNPGAMPRRPVGEPREVPRPGNVSPIDRPVREPGTREPPRPGNPGATPTRTPSRPRRLPPGPR